MEFIKFHFISINIYIILYYTFIMQFRFLSDEKRDYFNFWKSYFEQNYGFKSLGPSYFKVPHTSSLFSGEVKVLLSEIENYLLETQFFDMGTNDHNTIRGLHRIMDENEEDFFFYNNKLRINCFSRPFYLFGNLSLLLPNEEITIEYDHSIKYSAISFEEKMRLVSGLDAQSYTLLERFYSQYSYLLNSSNITISSTIK